MSKSIPKEKRLKVFEKFNGKCAYCGNAIEYSKMHIDHITPKFRGWSNSELEKFDIIKGTDNIENLNPSCISCNTSKSTFTIDKWRKEIQLKHDRLLRDNSSYRLLNRFGLIKFNNIIVFEFEKDKINKSTEREGSNG